MAKIVDEGKNYTLRADKHRSVLLQRRLFMVEQ